MTVNKFHSTTVASTMALIMAAVSASAVSAQDVNDDQDAAKEAPEEIEEIVVTGIRASLKSARDLKRNADTAIDSITSSDASGLPDLSVGEALARVPGLVVQRFGLGASDGDFPSPEGGQNLIRGLTLVRSEFNGRDAFSANGGRALDFGTIPPVLIGAVDVYKNSSADLIPGGIGGTINLRTLEPFDREGRIAVVSIDGTFTDLRDEFTPELNVVLGDRWETSGGEFGLLGSFSTSELKSDLHGFQIGQLYPINIGGENVAVPGGFQLRTNEVDRKRDSYYAAGQWRSEDRDLQITMKYARIENEVNSDERTLEWFGDGEMWHMTGSLDGNYSIDDSFSSTGLPHCNGSNDPDLANASCENTTPVTGFFESGIITNTLRDWTGSSGANMSNLGIHQEDRSMTSDFSINVKWNATEQLFIELDAHQTKARFNRDRLWAGTRFFSNFELNADIDNPQLRLVPAANNNPFRPECVWGGCATPLTAELDDPANTFLMFAADEFQDNEGDMKAFKADVQYDFDNDSWFESVKFGARFAERDQINRSAGLNWAGLAPPWAGGYYLGLDDLATPGHEVVDYSDFMRGGVVVGDHTSSVFVDRALLSDYDAFAAAMAADPLVNGVADWSPLRENGVVDYAGRGTIGDVLEKTTEAYVRFDFSKDLDNGGGIDANIGVRYSKTTVQGVGELDYINVTDADVALFSPETVAFFEQASENLGGDFKTNEYWLPSFNFKYSFNDQSLIRFAVSKAITRPNISQLRSTQVAVPSFRYEVDETTVPATTLDIVPTVINIWGGNPDLEAIESWNYDLSFEHYFGEQDSFTLNLFKKDISKNIIWESETREVLTLDGNQVPVIFNGDLNQDSADIKGFEVAYQHFFDKYDGFLGNLGLQANYTYIDAKTNSPLPINDANTQDPAAGDAFARIYRYGVPDYLGLSKHTYNLIGIYQDDGGLEVRVAYNWRSSHASSYRDFVTGNPIFQQSRGYLDASVKYDINETVQFRLQAANILDTVAKANQQIDASGQQFGRTAFVGDRRIKAGFQFTF